MKIFKSNRTFVLAVGFAILGIATAADEAKNAKDSYLMALQNSHQINANRGSEFRHPTVVRIAREDYSSIPSSSYEYSLTPSSGYGAPAPKPVYGPPSPKPVYGPPAPVYGPPPQTAPAPSHGMPFLSPEGWLLSKLKFKLNWFTLAKILLKIVIFKKIVKFIALLCLLFFIPTLKPSESDNSDSGEGERGYDYRRRNYDLKYDYDHRLKEVTRFALKAMEAFTVDNEIYCPEENLLSCRAKRMFDVIDEEYPLQSILRMFAPYSKAVQTAFRMQPKIEDNDDSDDEVNGNSIDQTSSAAAAAADSNEGVERDD